MEKHHHYEEITYLYDSEEEKEKHSKEMREQGYEDSGKYAMMLNSLMDKEPAHRLCGVYFKYHS